MKRFLIICLCLIGFDSLFLNAQDINGNSLKTMIGVTDKKEQILYFEGKHPTFTKCGLPFLYIMFHDSGKVSVLQGYYPYKSSFYQSCWYSDLTKKNNDSTYSGYTRPTIVGSIHKKNLKKIELYNRNGEWYCKIENEERELLLQPYIYSEENEKRRNIIYYLAKGENADYISKTNYSWKVYWRTEVFHLDTSFVRLSFKQLSDELEVKYLNEFERIKAINSFKANVPFYLFEKEGNEDIEKGRISNTQKLFDLLKQSVPIEEPESFNPIYSIKCNPLLTRNFKKHKWKLNNYDFFISDHIFTIDGYWYKINTDITKQLFDLIK